MNKAIYDKLNRVIEILEKYQSFSSSLDNYYVFWSEGDNKVLIHYIGTYYLCINKRTNVIFHWNSSDSNYKSNKTHITKVSTLLEKYPELKNEVETFGVGKLKNFSIGVASQSVVPIGYSDSLDSIREMAREDAETYKAEGMNPNKLSKEELAEKCYKERVKYPSDEAKKVFVDEFLANFSAEDAYVLYSYWLGKNSNKETHLDILLVSSKENCEKLKALKTSGDTDGDIIRYKINSYSTFIRKPGAREAIKKYKTTI